MKIEYSRTPKFTPITVTITLETKEELIDLTKLAGKGCGGVSLELYCLLYKISGTY